MVDKVQTEVVIRGKAQGFGEVNAAAQSLGQRSAQAMAKVDKEVKKLDDTFRQLTDRQVELTKVMADIEDTASPAYRRLAKDMAAVQQEASQVERTMRNLQRAYKETGTTADQVIQRREQRRGAFSQGLLQGMIPEAAYLQRGPGMARQAAGAAIGARARGVAGGMAQIPFSGAAGLAQALQSVPGGGFLAMPLMQTMQYAQQALQFRQQRQQLMPFLQMGAEVGGGVAVGQTPAQQRAQALRQADRMMAQVAVRGERGRGGVLAAVEEAVDPAGAIGTAIGAIGEIFEGGVRGRLRQEQRKRDIVAAGGGEAFAQRQREAERQRIADRIIEQRGGIARQRVRPRTLQDIIRTQGQQMGFALPEAMQFMGGVTQAGGGVGRELATQQMGTAAMAAQRLYGIGADVSGAFLQAGRRGGVVGARGRGGEAMVEAIAGGMQMGLEGSELTTFMQQMAGDIRAWQQTGIPINTTSVAAIGASLARTGLGGIRGAAVTRGLTARARELTTRGPQGAEELIMLQELGGFGGGGVEDYEQAQLRLEQGGFDPEDVRRMMRRLMAAGGGGAGGRAVFRRAMRRFGVNIGVAETQLMEKQITGQELTPDEEARIKQIDTQIAQVAGGAPETVGAMGRKAIEATNPALQKQANITNQQIAAGNAMLGVMQSLEKTTRNVATGFTRLAGEPLTNLTRGIEGLSNEIPGLASKLKDLVAGNYGALIVSPGE
jgi:hypothetical protein